MKLRVQMILASIDFVWHDTNSHTIYFFMHEIIWKEQNKGCKIRINSLKVIGL